ncbi:hypothetical protein [Dysgonomonas sp. Marseille-Q5470]|uniref:hypothetical protein n=1 Tax=Dysgonomonas sp. Marseille-Q5470 TaxID=3039494 RepID=UPI0024BD5C38|nr:hypothetical protein [Dysgonomonas sp. Marseille-Q5470]
MLGELYINDKDAWSTWKARLVDDSLDILESSASMKSYVTNNARSQDGVQIFISNPRIDMRSVILTFAITCESRLDYLSKKRDLEMELRKGLTLFKVVPLSLIFKLHLDENSTMTLLSGTGLRDGKFTIRFTEKNPKDRISL